jgi:hypothetical protein
MQFERGKPPETPNAPYRAARIKDERWSSAEPGFEPGRAGPRLSERLPRTQCIGKGSTHKFRMTCVDTQHVGLRLLRRFVPPF